MRLVVKVAVLLAALWCALSVEPSLWVIGLMLTTWLLGAMHGIEAAVHFGGRDLWAAVLRKRYSPKSTT